MTRTDRGAERRRLLEAVGNDEESESPNDDAEAAGAQEDRPEPAPDGGTVTLGTPVVHCGACDRTYLEAPEICDGCGADEFVERPSE